MTKKDLKITIEENILEKGRKAIPNLSEFFEECLKHYLGLSDGMYPIVNDQEILDNIGKLQAKLFINRQNFDLQESIRNIESEEKNKTWRFLWNEYRRTLRMDEKLLKKAIEELGKNEEELEDILDWTYITNNQVDTNYWEDVLKKYEENKDEF